MVTFLSLIILSATTVYLFQLMAAPWRAAVEQDQLLQAARSETKQEGVWDESALGVAYHMGGAPNKGRKNATTLKFWLYARKSLSQPNRLRLWFTGTPRKWLILLYSDDTKLPIAVGNERGRVVVNGDFMEIEYMAPPLSSHPGLEAGRSGQLYILVTADGPIDVTKTAAHL